MPTMPETFSSSTNNKGHFYFFVVRSVFFFFFFDIQYSLSKQHSKRPLENLIVIKRRLEFLVIVKLVTIVVKRDYPLWN